MNFRVPLPVECTPPMPWSTPPVRETSPAAEAFTEAFVESSVKHMMDALTARRSTVAPELAGDCHCSDRPHTRTDLGHDLLLWQCANCGHRTFTYRIDAPVTVTDEITAIARVRARLPDPLRWWRVAGFVIAALSCCAAGAGLALLIAN